MKKENYDQMNRFEHQYWWHVGRRFIFTRLIRRYAACFKNDLSIVDVGCGTGGNFEFLENFGRVLGADNSTFAVEYCRKKGKTVKLVSKDVLPFPDGSCDLVTVFDVLEHIENDGRMIEECRRILKKGGKIVAAVPAYMSIWSSHDEILGHRRRYSKKELLGKVEERGFRTIKITHCITFMFPIIFVFRLISKKFSKSSRTNSAYFMLPGIINSLLAAILRVESCLIDKIEMPFGCSVVIVAEKI
ncbi:MAG: methyltransferase domain-containing protein [Candidatus Paceibacterota bacterium]